MSIENFGYIPDEHEILEIPPEEQLSLEKYDELQEKLQDEPDETVEDLMIELLGQFNRTKTEFFYEANEVLKTFIRKVSEKFQPEDARQIYDALTLMYTLHFYQKDRPEGNPYIIHPIRVAENVIELMDKPEKYLVIASLLHDSTEDQAEQLKLLEVNDSEQAVQVAPKSFIEHRYGNQVVKTMEKLTNPDFEKILAENGITREHKNFKKSINELYAENVAKEIKDPDALLIKLCDFYDNTASFSRLPKEKRLSKIYFINRYLR